MNQMRPFILLTEIQKMTHCTFYYSQALTSAARALERKVPVLSGALRPWDSARTAATQPFTCSSFSRSPLVKTCKCSSRTDSRSWQHRLQGDICFHRDESGECWQEGSWAGAARPPHTGTYLPATIYQLFPEETIGIYYVILYYIIHKLRTAVLAIIFLCRYLEIIMLLSLDSEVHFLEKIYRYLDSCSNWFTLIALFCLITSRTKTHFIDSIWKSIWTQSNYQNTIFSRACYS